MNVKDGKTTLKKLPHPLYLTGKALPEAPCAGNHPSYFPVDHSRARGQYITFLSYLSNFDGISQIYKVGFQVGLPSLARKQGFRPALFMGAFLSYLNNLNKAS